MLGCVKYKTGPMCSLVSDAGTINTPVPENHLPLSTSSSRFEANYSLAAVASVMNWS